jgi:hypothetical protein
MVSVCQSVSPLPTEKMVSSRQCLPFSPKHTQHDDHMLFIGSLVAKTASSISLT